MHILWDDLGTVYPHSLSEWKARAGVKGQKTVSNKQRKLSIGCWNTNFFSQDQQTAQKKAFWKQRREKISDFYSWILIQDDVGLHVCSSGKGFSDATCKNAAMNIVPFSAHDASIHRRPPQLPCRKRLDLFISVCQNPFSLLVCCPNKRLSHV